MTINNPNQIVLITSRYKNKDNIIAVTWWTKISFKPEHLYLISIGKSRFSYYLIKKGKCFVINFMPYELSNKILFCGTKSGRNINKFKECKFNQIGAKKINCPIIREALAYLECKVVKEISSGDHTLFIGKVLNEKTIKKGKRAFQLENNKFTTTVD